MSTATLPTLVPMSEVGNQLGGLSRSTVYQLIDSGRLRRVTIGRRAFVTGRSIEQFLATLLGNTPESDTQTGEPIASAYPGSQLPHTGRTTRLRASNAPAQRNTRTRED